MNDTNTAEREAFEAWYARRHPQPVHENSTWAHASKIDDWEVWQACAEAMRGFDAADMATASAQGFRDGVASLAASEGADCERCSGSGEDPEGFYDQSRGDAGHTHEGPCRSCGGSGVAASAGSEPVAWQCRHLLDVTWQLCDAEVAAIRATRPRKWAVRPLYTHPSPPEGMAGWISVDERLPQPFTTVLIHPRPTGYCCEGEVNTQRQWSYGEYKTGFGHRQIKCNPTHWQPLPAPPLPASEAKDTP